MRAGLAFQGIPMKFWVRKYRGKGLTPNDDREVHLDEFKGKGGKSAVTRELFNQLEGRSDSLQNRGCTIRNQLRLLQLTKNTRKR
jgi:hypothetical protein